LLSDTNENQLEQKYRSPDSASSMQLYITRNGQQFGPYSIEEVRNHLSSGEMMSTDLAWHHGAADWMPLTQVLAKVSSTPPSSKAAPAQASNRAWVPPRRDGSSPSPVMPGQVSGNAPPTKISPGIAPGFDTPRQQSSSDVTNKSRRKQRSSSSEYYGRPLSITVIGVVLCILGTICGLDTFYTISTSHEPLMFKILQENPGLYSLQFGMWAAISIINFVIGVNIINAQNWARWLYVIFSASLITFGLITNPDKLEIIPPLAFQSVVIIFLFLPKANAYFSRP